MTDTEKLDVILKAVTGALSRAPTRLSYHPGTGSLSDFNAAWVRPEGTFATGNRICP